MAKRILILTILSFISLNLTSQVLYPVRGSNSDTKCEIRINLEDYQIYIYDFANGDTITRYGDSLCIRFFIHSCDGKMSVEEWYIDDDNKLISVKAKGEYEASLDILKRYVVREVDFDSYKVGVSSYYEPLKHGSWKYFSKSGDLILEEVYELGILISSRKPSSSPNAE